jgi:organic radical activating enzyme
MDINNFYIKADMGERSDISDLLYYIKSFDNLILWGASALGEAVGEFLIKNNVFFKEYWDQRADELGSVNGKIVVKPFSSDYNKDNTLLIFNISNKVVENTFSNVIMENFVHFLWGKAVFMGLICPSNNENGLIFDYCLKSKACLKIYCPRLHNLFAAQFKNQTEKYPIHLHSATLIVNQLCNLSCMHCTSYMGSYPKDKRINFQLENIIRDIDSLMASVDSVATLTVMGGEPFMHPDIAEIIQHLLKFDRIGYISMPSNGVYPIKSKQLMGLKDKHFVVAFNNYLPSLSEKMKITFDSNVDLVSKSGVSNSVGNYMPSWAVPSTFFKKEFTSDVLKSKLKDCRDKKNLCNQIKNGKLHPCDFANSLHNLEVADYPDSYVDLTNTNNLRQIIYDFINRPVYSVCEHCCNKNSKAADGSALQGKLDYFTPGAELKTSL